MKITILGNPISKKNSQRILRLGNGRTIIAPSKQYKDYEARAKEYMPDVETISYPVNVKCIFYMGTRRKCDITNLEQAALDILVKYGVLADDNYTIVSSKDGSRVKYDKENPRTEITIEEAEDDN